MTGRHKKIMKISLWAAGIMAAASMFGFTHHIKNHSNYQPSAQTINTSSTTLSTTASTTTAVKVAVKKPAPKPVATSTTPTTPTSGETTLKAYLTGYAWPDNTPPGSDISNPVIHQKAGGTGTYADPITVAVGHSFINGKDVLDYPAGTKFYVPNLRKYFIAEDTCGDGNTPQNGPCHSLKSAPTGAQVWLDLWVGGVGASQAPVLACEDAITDLHTVILNPASNYAVNVGAVYGTSCAQQYGEAVAKL